MPPPREPGSALGWALGAAALVAVALALALLLDLGPFADDELSRGEFVTRADDICADAHDAFRDLQRDPPRTGREAGDLTGRLAEIAGDERDRIADLDAPADLDPLVERYLEARERASMRSRTAPRPRRPMTRSPTRPSRPRSRGTQLDRRRLAQRDRPHRVQPPARRRLAARARRRAAAGDRPRGTADGRGGDRRVARRACARGGRSRATSRGSRRRRTRGRLGHPDA